MNLLGGTPRRMDSVFRLTDNSTMKRRSFGISLFFKYRVNNVAYVCIRRIKIHEMKDPLYMGSVVETGRHYLLTLTSPYGQADLASFPNETRSEVSEIREMASFFVAMAVQVPHTEHRNNP